MEDNDKQKRRPRGTGSIYRQADSRFLFVSESDLAEAALKVEQGGREELPRSDVIHRIYIAEAESEADAERKRRQGRVQSVS